MGLFSTASSYLGIDFDANSIKVVELKNESGRPRLVTYGFIDKEVEKIKGSQDDSSIATAQLVKQVCRKAKVSSNKVITALPAYSVFSSILNLPAMSRKDLASAVKWEAKKVIPLPIDEMILDWKLLEDFDGEIVEDQKTSKLGKGLRKIGSNVIPKSKKKKFLHISSKSQKDYSKVLLTAASKDLVKKHIDIFKNADLNLLSLDTEAFALIRSLVGNDKATMMIVDIGSVVTNISIIHNSIPVLNRSIEVGGLTITKAIANSLNISLDRAEQFKYDIGMSQDRLGQGSVPKTIETTLTPIVDELRYSLNLYKNKDQENIEKVILTGGSSMLLNLPEYLSKVLDLRIFLGDPWARVIYPEELKPVLDEIGPRFSVAVGLAMRDIE